MLDERTIDLVQRDIDHEGDDAERVELHQRLDRDPEAEIYAGEMLLMTTLLAQISLEDPPADFTAAVMKRVRAHTAERSTNKTLLEPTAFQRRGRRTLRLGFGLAAAATIAFLLAPSLFHTLRPAQLRGLMLPPAVQAEQSWTVAAGPRSTIEVTVTPKQLLLRFDVPSGSEGAADLVFDATALAPPVVEGASTQPGAAAGQVHITLSGGRPVVRFDRKGGRAAAVSVAMQLTKQTNYRTQIEISPSTNFRQ